MAIITVTDWASFITAVGTSGADVEFPKNLVKTADTSVDPNKLYTDANGVVQTNVQPSDLANLYENTFVLDANDENSGFREGLTTSIAINCASLKGFGGTIINLSSNGVNVFEMQSGTNIDGIAVLNLDCMDCNFIHSTWNGSAGTISHSIVASRYEANTSSDRKYYLLFASRVVFSSCAFTVSLYGTMARFSVFDSYWGHSNFSYCRLNTEDHRYESTGTGSEEWLNQSNCYWKGTFNRPIVVSSDTGYDDYTVVDVTAPSVDSNNSTTGSHVYVNSEKTTVGNHCVSVTTANLQSASDLAALGFPIQT